MSVAAHHVSAAGSVCRKRLFAFVQQRTKSKEKRRKETKSLRCRALMQVPEAAHTDLVCHSEAALSALLWFDGDSKPQNQRDYEQKKVQCRHSWASIIQINAHVYFTRSGLHSTGTTALLDKGQQVCRQPCIALPLMSLMIPTFLKLMGNTWVEVCGCEWEGEGEGRGVHRRDWGD